MPTQFAIIAVDRTSFSNAEVRTRFLDDVKQFSRKGMVTRTDWHDFARHVAYHQRDFTDTPDDGGGHPELLAGAGLNRARARIVVEKLIGHDLNSAWQLSRALTVSFHESQIFRIDHYLGKETVQNILAYVRAGPMCVPEWTPRDIAVRLQLSPRSRSCSRITHTGGLSGHRTIPSGKGTVMSIHIVFISLDRVIRCPPPFHRPACRAASSSSHGCPRG